MSKEEKIDDIFVSYPDLGEQIRAHCGQTIKNSSSKSALFRVSQHTDTKTDILAVLCEISRQLVPISAVAARLNKLHEEKLDEEFKKKHAARLQYVTYLFHGRAEKHFKKLRYRMQAQFRYRCGWGTDSKSYWAVNHLLSKSPRRWSSEEIQRIYKMGPKTATGIVKDSRQLPNTTFRQYFSTNGQ